MRLLLDTQVILWQVREPDRLGSAAVEAIDAAHDVRLSAVSFIEIGIKAATGKLPVHPALRQAARSADLLDVTAEHGLALATLPLHHRDPFDRLLIAQARAEGLTVVTSDAQFAKYDVPVIDARA